MRCSPNPPVEGVGVAVPYQVRRLRYTNSRPQWWCTAKEFGESVGKTVVNAQDTPGFIVNRLLLPFLLEAVKLLESGMATKEDIDKAVTLGLNHPMGPLRLSDLIGLDTAYYICNAMYEEMKDPRFAPPVLLKKMVTAGQYGRKSRKGFYDYQPG